MKTWFKLKQNPAFRQILFLREKIIRVIRDFFYQENFHEVFTPVLVPALIPESYLEVFETFLRRRDGSCKKLYLIPSPEVSIKKLLVGGIGNCFEISRSFRNGEMDSRFHQPEFTLLEWYRVGANYEKIMEDCEKLIAYLNLRIKNKKEDLKITYQGREIDLTAPWERISVVQAFLKYAKVPYSAIDNLEKIRRVAVKKGYSVKKEDSWEQLFHQIYLNEVEPHLGRGRPTVIYDYPKELAALAKIKKTDPRFCERFEFYIGGLELGDCYTELTDWREQEERFKKELKKVSVVADSDFLAALKTGLPDCAGIAVGVDRLVMLFADVVDIKETLPFPFF